MLRVGLRRESELHAVKARRRRLLSVMAVRAWVPCLILLLALPIHAQKTSGQITGTVIDQTGIGLPDTTITATQVGTNLKRTAKTDREGNYTITNLPIGNYRISVTLEGFKEATVANVIVNVLATARLDFTLQEVGAGERVEINIDDLQVETQTGALGEVLYGEQVSKLPLNGRSFVQLTQLQPGVSAANNLDSKYKGLFAGVDFSVNGNSSQSNLFLVDGAYNNDPGSNRTILLYPSIESITSLRVLRNSYGPEFGQAAGSVISIATRGGENQFHGSAFYFGRTDKFNSIEFISQRGGNGKDKLLRNDLGFSLGGPIIKDRLFFFFSEELNRETRGATRFGSVPTVAERNGDFSRPRFQSNGGRCSGPAIGNDRPGTETQVIPQAAISQAGRLLAQLYPLPNVSNNFSCTNWVQSVKSPINFRQENVRLDYKLSESQQIFGRYTQDHWSNAAPILYGAGLFGDDPFPGVESSWRQPSRQTAVKLTSTLSDTMVNEVQFSYSANRVNITTEMGGGLNRQINQAIPGFFSSDGKVNGINRPHPIFFGGIQPYSSYRGPNLMVQAPFQSSLDSFSVRDDLSKVSGDHTFKAGVLVDKVYKDEDTSPQSETVQFYAPFSVGEGEDGYRGSGNYLADILTSGSLFIFSEGNREKVAHSQYTNLESYFGDTWRFRPGVTLELGARYSLFFEPYDADDRLSSFNPAFYDPSKPVSDPCNGLVVPKGTNPCAGIAGASTPSQFSNRSLRNNSYKNIAPRLGVAWDVFKDGKTAVRSGFGLFYLRERIQPAITGLAQNPPFVTAIGGQRTLDGQVIQLNAASQGAPSASLTPEAKSPYSAQFNISVAQELRKEMVIEIGYVGNRARNQLTTYDLNQPVAANRLAAALATTADQVNALRPFSNYGSIYQFARTGTSNYDSMQVLFRTRLRKSSQFQASYTWSKSLADFGLSDSGSGSPSSLLDTYNPRLNYGPSDLNRPHIFVANARHSFPDFKNAKPWMQKLFGGWEVAGIVQITSGTSLTPNINATGVNFDLDGTGPGTVTRPLLGGISGLGTAQDNQRPNRAEGVSCASSGIIDEFLNPNAFTLVGMGIGEVGNAGRGACLGPPTKNVDFSFYKNFAPRWLVTSLFGESSQLQFRLEFFNAFNTIQFRGDSVNTIFFSGTVSCGNAACGPGNNLITSQSTPSDQFFGRSGTTRGGREIQYALRLTF